MTNRTGARVVDGVDRAVVHARSEAESGAGAEAGIASVLLVLLTGAFLALAGLVWDGGRAIDARQHAANLAEQAARTGANDLDTSAVRDNGTYTLLTANAIADACRYVRVASPNSTCTATATPTAITVHVTTRTPTAVLGIVGISTMTSHGSATATAVRGLTTPDATTSTNALAQERP